MTDFEALLGALQDGGVRFAVVGGVAARAHGSVRPTADLDIVYARDASNLERIAAALDGLAPYLRGAPPGLPFRLDAETLRRGLNFTLVTRRGDLDLLGEMLGVGGFDQVMLRAVHFELFGRRIACVGIEDLIAAKRAAGRPKDLDAVAELEVLRAGAEDA